MKSLIDTEKIEKYIKDNELNKEKFCKHCGISTATYRNMYSSETMRVTTIKKIADGMGMRMLEILIEK